MSKDAKGNIHLAEERGQVHLRDNENEEIMYSGVIRNKATKLKDRKKFTCIRKKVVPFQNQSDKMKNTSIGGLLNSDQWLFFNFKSDSL
jgi:PAB1-binding protein PBP1